MPGERKQTTPRGKKKKKKKKKNVKEIKALEKKLMDLEKTMTKDKTVVGLQQKRKKVAEKKLNLYTEMKEKDREAYRNPEYNRRQEHAVARKELQAEIKKLEGFEAQ